MKALPGESQPVVQRWCCPAANAELRWPKMDLTNARSMEFFRKLGIADDLRMQGKDKS
jgi:hypothetical protein